MAGTDPAIHVFLASCKDVDARHKAGHDEVDSLTGPPHPDAPTDTA
jgi:hypothetical protein